MSAIATLEELQNDLAALQRVRNRLALAPRSKQPSILAALLPRLLSRLDQLILIDDDQARFQCRQEILNQLTGILAHSLELIRLDPLSHVALVHAVAPLSIRLESMLARTSALSILGVVVPFGHDDGVAQCLPALLQLVDQTAAAAQAPHTLLESRTTGDATTLAFQKASWLLMDALVRASGVEVRSDADRNAAIPSRSWSDLSESVPMATTEAQAVVDANGQGVMDLLLDVLLFWPAVAGTSLTMSLDNSTGISEQGLLRMNLRGRAWDDVYLRQVKYIMVRYALCPVGGGLLRASERAWLIAVLAADNNSMHGRLAMTFLNPVQWTTRKYSGCSVELACSILILVLGDAAASKVLETHASLKAQWEAILGPRPTIQRLMRSPLPVTVASLAVEYIRDHFQSRCLIEQRQSLQLFVELASAIQEPRRGVYWGISVVQRLYRELQVSNVRDSWTKTFYMGCLETAKAVVDALPDDGGNMDGAGHGHAHELLPLGVPEPFGNRRDLNRLLSRQRADRQSRMLQQDDAVYARGLALDMVAELVQEPTLFLDDINDMIQSIVSLTASIIAWTSFESKKNQDALLRALDALRIYWHHALAQPGYDSMARPEHAVAPLLPSILCAATSDSPDSRHLAALWSAELLCRADPAAAIHILQYLRTDSDGNVATLAKKASASLVLSDSMVSVTPAPIGFLDLRCKDTRSSLLETICIDRARNATTIDHSLRTADTQSSCGICYDETMDPSESYSLPCQHNFCRCCWSGYLDTCFTGPPTRIARLACPHHQCNELLAADDVANLRPEIVPAFEEALLSAFVESSPRHRRCPGDNCSIVAHSLSCSPNQAVTCPTCTTRFCFGCSNAPHEPASCESLHEWSRIFDSSTFWVQKNAKPCPSCRAMIEKANGCNHIDCSQCGAAFCWICLAPLRRHLEPHVCNRYDQADNATNDDERRALFFTERYQAHHDAEEFALERIRNIEEQSEVIAERLWYADEDQLDTYAETAATLVTARRFLKYSYVAMWSIRNNSEKGRIFERYQATLENVTERLTRLTDRNLENLYNEQGSLGVHAHFRALAFLSSCVIKYLARVTSLLAQDER